MLKLTAYNVARPGNKSNSFAVLQAVEKVADSLPLLSVFSGSPAHQLVFVKYEHDANYVAVSGGLSMCSPGWTTAISDDTDFIERKLGCILTDPIESIKVIRVGIPANGFSFDDFQGQIPNQQGPWHGYCAHIVQGKIAANFIGVIPVHTVKGQILIAPKFFAPKTIQPTLTFPPDFDTGL